MARLPRFLPENKTGVLVEITDRTIGSADTLYSVEGSSLQGQRRCLGGATGL